MIFREKSVLWISIALCGSVSFNFRTRRREEEEKNMILAFRLLLTVVLEKSTHTDCSWFYIFIFVFVLITISSFVFIWRKKKKSRLHIYSIIFSFLKTFLRKISNPASKQTISHRIDKSVEWEFCWFFERKKRKTVDLQEEKK